MKTMNAIFIVVLITLATTTFAQTQIIQNMKITGGSPGVGKILTSDATGVVSWQYPPGSGSGSGNTVAVTAVSSILSTTGKVWMDRNLGASRRAQSATDCMAYGQLYQWGRSNDGHADIVWTSGTVGTPVNGITSNLSTTDYPNDNLFITSSADWRSTQNNNRWQGVAGTNNPCPLGYRLPTITELTAEFTAYSITNSATAFASPLKFILPGYRHGQDGLVEAVGNVGVYWSSTLSGTNAFYRDIMTSNTTQSIGWLAIGASVRCLKD